MIRHLSLRRASAIIKRIMLMLMICMILPSVADAQQQDRPTAADSSREPSESASTKSEPANKAPTEFATEAESGLETLLTSNPDTETSPAAAIDADPLTPSAKNTAPTSDYVDSSAEQAATFARLKYIQEVLTQKLTERTLLGERIESANEQDKVDLRRQADEITRDVTQLRTTLENIAIGGVNTNLFNAQEAKSDSDWRQDVALIAQPVIDSLKDLTEKPRKLKELSERIELLKQEFDAATLALNSLDPIMSFKPQGELEVSLNRLEKLWRGRRDDALNNIKIARIQVAELQGDKTLTQTIFSAMRGFATGRGLTLLIALLVALAVYLAVRFVLRGYRAALAEHNDTASRTRYRLAAYSVHALTFLLILIAIFVVFYQRGDVLLLGLLILLIVGLALGIRNLLPQYLSEAKLLLNVGAMRESERIEFRGLPWRVESINLYTVLRNPELHGVIRIPLSQLHQTTSRPSGKDPWFPSSRGDIILLDNQLLEVIQQNPDTIELKHRGGQHISVPSAQYYGMSIVNLSRGSTFGVNGTFGIDYQHQDISLIRVPKLLRDYLREALSQTDIHDFVKDIRVEVKEANASSIDYWIFVTCDSLAAKSFKKIERLIQRSCINACTKESLSIPFPHVSVVQNA